MLIQKEQYNLLKFPLNQLRNFDGKMGIYFLYNKSTLIYIGKSIDIRNRIPQHKRTLPKFDSFSFYECEKKELNKTERLLIKELNPKNNAMIYEYQNGHKIYVNIPNELWAKIEKEFKNKPLLSDRRNSYNRIIVDALNNRYNKALKNND
ncbi:MAG: GIY-YIG nuclease family protein [Candidatus Anammoxibacter sp.]